MNAATLDSYAKPSTRSMVALVTVVTLVIAGLAVADLLLERAEQSELWDAAHRAETRGIRLLHEGKADQSIELLGKAHALRRENLPYALQLIEAMLVVGNTAEAEPLMSDVLQTEPNDGAANLTAARLALRKGKMSEAEAYFHRAIYGQWNDDPAAHRVAARVELVRFLVSRHKHDELLSELLPLQAEAGADPALESQLAAWFLDARAPDRAAGVYRAILAHDPKNANAYAGLGEAELQLGDYRSAHGNFLEASYHNPSDKSVRSRLDLASTLADLDPGQRHLSPREKYARSLRILTLAHASLADCLAQHPSSQGSELLATDEATLTAHELPEAVLLLAEKSWQFRVQSCGAEEPLRLLMQKLAPEMGTDGVLIR